AVLRAPPRLLLEAVHGDVDSLVPAPGELLVGLVPVVDGASRDLRLLGGGADVRSARELLEEAFLACLSGVLAGALTCPSRPSVGHGSGPDRDDRGAVDRA